MSLPLDDRSLYINRELSWLDFNARVLREALDPRTPLLERLKFHGIFATNLDEFYMVRVGGLRRKAAAGLAEPYADGLTPTDALDAIDRRVRELRETQTSHLRDTVLPELAGRDVRILHPDELTAEQWETLDDYFETQVYPVLTPLAVDPGHPFPYLSNLSLSLAVMLRDAERGDEHFARVKVPKSLSRWVPTSVPTHFVPLEEVIRANLDALFPGMIVVGAHLFRVTRYSDLDLSDGEHGDDLLAAIEEQVFRRRFGEVVRLEVQTGMPSHIRQLIIEELGADHEADAPGLTPRDIHEFDGLLELGDLITLAQLDLPDLRDPPFTPVVPRSLRTGGNFFEALRSNDLLVHHPFHSFTATVEDFIAQAARDPHVLAIKMTLYRTSGDTAIVRALLEAAERGKEVVVLVELKARFDEQNNIAWAKTLESYGIHVAYGSAALKTHAKTALVVRREAEGIRLYAHIGSGNYNTRSARVYTDVGLFTASPAIGADLRDLFNSLTGFVRERPYRRLLVAPTSLRAGILALIDREAEHARSGRGGRIIAKMNALVDEQIIRALYQASQAGVAVELIVRGICCLRPGVPGVSDNVRVISIVGRFLEHSRLWYFGNGGIGEYYLGSADWMPRNFDHRVEAVTPIDDRSLHPRLGALLQACLDDNRQAWDLGADGVWRQRHAEEGEPERSVHRILLGDPWGLAARSSPREQLAFWSASAPS
ncbi:MAG TPA: polyphosphate kinase 1 [Gemmatimonadaceae bacterium]|nr:polyphosphate kinase 1 [Gemmatimonadaceae bacterium]